MENMELMEQNAALAEGQNGARLADLAASIRARDLEDQYLANTMLSHAVEKGRWLTEAKTLVRHGEWGEWLKREVDYSQSKAQNLMRLYQRYGDNQESLFGPSKSQALGNLSVTKALLMLNVPDGPELDEFVREYDVESMSTRELEAALKERDEARLEAEQARVDRRTADEAREKMSREVALANGRIAELDAAAKGEAARAREAEEAARRAEEEAARLSGELEELRSRPVEVAVGADPAAIEAARKEVEAAMQDKVDRAAAARDEALEKRYEAEKAAKAAEEAKAAALKGAEEARAELGALRAQAERAERRAALASNEDVARFRAIFGQLQKGLDELADVLGTLRKKNPPVAEGLSRAVSAFGDNAKAVAAG